MNIARDVECERLWVYLVPLMVTHTVVDVWSFALSAFGA